MRKTKIICTMGPATDKEGVLEELIHEGMNVARFNFSHGSHEEQSRRMEMVRELRRRCDKPVAMLLDTKGPEIRLRDIENGRTQLETGQTFTLTTEEILGTAQRVSITYKNLVKDIKEGTTILIDDGLIEMVAEKIEGTEIICKVINGGPISNHKGVNVPNAVLSMPYISEVDRSDILFGIEMGFDFIACSFARTKEDILQVRSILDEHNSKMKIIAKIENMQGIENLEEILSVSDGIMVARGDMGVEIPMEEVPVLQKRMIHMAEKQGKHVITATQMLESMIKNPRPTRAEVTDIANAIYDGTTAIMLSGESAAGLYPVEAVKTMARIAERAEQDIDYKGRLRKRELPECVDTTTGISYATCSTAMELKASAIITVTMSGFTAAMVSRYKPDCPVIGCSVNPQVCRQLNLNWGIAPLLMKEEETEEALFKEAIRVCKDAGYVKTGDRVVLTAGVPLGMSGTTNMIRVIDVD